MASKPLKDEVQKLFRPFEKATVQYLLSAWDMWWKNPDRPLLNYRRSQTCIVHNHAMNAAIAGFQDRKGIRVITRESHETAYFMINQRLLFRLKKGDEKGLTRNYPTQASLAFVDPNENLSLFSDLPDVWRVDIAYTLNYLRTRIENILVVARDEGKILWSYLIYDSAAEADAPSPIPLPVGPYTPPPAESGLRIVGADRNKRKKHDSEK